MRCREHLSLVHDHVSPLAVPALLEIGREMVAGAGHEDILREAEDALIADAMRVE